MGQGTHRKYTKVQNSKRCLGFLRQGSILTEDRMLRDLRVVSLITTAGPQLSSCRGRGDYRVAGGGLNYQVAEGALMHHSVSTCK
jgi:hypothetical protein